MTKIRLVCRTVGGDQWKGLTRREQENKILLQILTREWDSLKKKLVNLRFNFHQIRNNGW